MSTSKCLSVLNHYLSLLSNKITLPLSPSSPRFNLHSYLNLSTHLEKYTQTIEESVLLCNPRCTKRLIQILGRSLRIRSFVIVIAHPNPTIYNHHLASQFVSRFFFTIIVCNARRHCVTCFANCFVFFFVSPPHPNLSRS